MSVLVATDTRVQNLVLAVNQLKVAIRRALCRACRAADGADCLATATACCDGCDHSLPLPDLDGAIGLIHDLLTDAIREEGN